ncbi:MAG: M48 family metallopeptidase [Spirochaetales bacterium]|nr:M48 family metallopeptidase [Spirochaetales bacterium]
MDFKHIVVLSILVVYFYDLILAIMREFSSRNPIPENVSDVYDGPTYAKWRAYHEEKVRHRIWILTAGFLVEHTLIELNVYHAFSTLFPENEFLQMFSVLLLLSASELLMIPFTYYDTMVIEGKYGFNKTKKSTFWADQIKEFVIGLLVLIGIGELLTWSHRMLGDWLILAFAVVMTLFALVTAFLYPVFSRIFNKFTPLEDGELKDRVTALLNSHGYKVRAIKVMDASRRTTKANAYFTGFGKMKTIVLFDNLVRTMTVDEICAVFAHEMGHGLHRDTLKNQILTFVQMAILSVLAWLTVRHIGAFTPFGFTSVNYGFALVLIIYVEFDLLSPLFRLLVNKVSRNAEYRADRQVVDEGYADAMISALKKLARENFSNLAPSPALVALEYSHPTLSQRIDAINKAVRCETAAQECQNM